MADVLDKDLEAAEAKLAALTAQIGALEGGAASDQALGYARHWCALHHPHIVRWYHAFTSNELGSMQVPPATPGRDTLVCR